MGIISANWKLKKVAVTLKKLYNFYKKSFLENSDQSTLTPAHTY